MLSRYYTCDSCRFTFTRTVMPEQCPDCGKYAVRPATQSEAEETIKLQEELNREKQLPHVTRK